MKGLRLETLVLLMVAATAAWAEGSMAGRCTVHAAERYACVETAEDGGSELHFQVGSRKHVEPLPEASSWRLRLGTVRDVALVRGVGPMAEDSSVKTLSRRLVGLEGTLLVLADPVHGFAPTGEWLATQRVRIPPPGSYGSGVAATSDEDLVVLRWDGREMRRVPGRRVFMHWPEDEDDQVAFSHDGRALLVYRSERREFDLYGLDGRTRDEVVPLADLAPGFAAYEFEFIDVDRIVVWQPEFFGRDTVDWLRVLTRDISGRFTSRVISYTRDGPGGYIELHGVAPVRGWLLLSAHSESDRAVGFHVVDLSGRLIWRHDLYGWSDLVGAMPDRDLRRWHPRLLSDGAILLDPNNRSMAEKSFVVRLTDVEEAPRWPGSAPTRLVVLPDDQPLARAASIVEVPREAAVDGSGQYALTDLAEGPRRLGAKRIVSKPPER